MFKFMVLLGTLTALARGSEVDPGPKPPCPSDNSVQAYFASNDCTRFWQCSNGVPYLMPCAPGTHWEQSLWTCVHIAASTCTGEGWSGIKAPTTTTTSTSSNLPCDDDASNPKPTSSDCDKLSSLCPAVDGYHSVYIPLANCSAFCQCSNGKAYYQPCPEGLHFNPSLNVCDWPQNAGCTGKPGTNPSTAVPCPGCSSTESSTSPCDDDAPNPKPTSSDCDKLSSLCPAVDGYHSVYIPLANCSAFCQCSNGKAYYQPCPEGLHFNPSLNVCDWPQDAGCTGKPGTTPSTERPLP